MANKLATALQENFAELLESSVTEEKKEGTVVKGVVISINNEYVTVDVGLKTEGLIPLREFALPGEQANVKVGEEVDVYLERIESRGGRAMLSREKAVRESAWKTLESNCDEGTTVEGVIFGRVKGGFTVDIGGVVAFLPGSQVDIRPVKDVTPLMNIKQPFQILKMDRKQGNIVVSRRAIMEESRAEARNELLAKVEEGTVLEGTVKNITDYGAFIDLGSVDGLLHVTDISWTRINHPSEVLSLGQKVKVIVIKFNPENKRISLGMKQLEENPWGEVANKYPKGAQVKGHVTNITDYGAFVELEPGVEGLVHVSELSWTKTNVNPKKLLTPGQEINVMVLEIDPVKHRISLGVKQCEENPWRKFADAHPVGNIVEGEIKNIVDFGMFVGFEGNIDGLVHISDVTWTGTPEEELKKFTPGEMIKVVVLGLEVEKERISLGIKQLTENPFEGALANIKKGSTVTCTVTEVKEDGIEVQVTEGVSSFIKRSDLSRDRVEQRPERFAVGDRVDAKVISLDKEAFKVVLSIKALEVEEQKKVIAEYGSTDSGASLGDILGAALGNANRAKETNE